MTPYEKVYIEVPEAYSGVVIQKMGQRHAKMDNMETREGISLPGIYNCHKRTYWF